MTETPVDQVLSECRDGVLLLTLNRPEKLNALTASMENRYYELLATAELDPEIRAIVVTGAGRGFCAGFDLSELAAVSATGRGAIRPSRPRHFPLSVAKPIIAAINGPCAGLGLIMALYCDLRFAATTARISTSFSKRGLVAELGSSWILPRLIGVGPALDLLLSSRQLTGTEAAEMRLVNRAVDPDQLLPTAVEYAAQLARDCSPASLAAIKSQVYSHLETSLVQATAETEEWMSDAIGWPDLGEGVASFVERREPRFPPLSAAVAEIAHARSQGPPAP